MTKSERRTGRARGAFPSLVTRASSLNDHSGFWFRVSGFGFRASPLRHFPTDEWREVRLPVLVGPLFAAANIFPGIDAGHADAPRAGVEADRDLQQPPIA